MIADRLRRLAGRVAAALAEIRDAERRVYAQQFSRDSYLLRPDEGPDDYDEFLARTAGPCSREPSASERARRQRGTPR